MPVARSLPSPQVNPLTDTVSPCRRPAETAVVQQPVTARAASSDKKAENALQRMPFCRTSSGRGAHDQQRVRRRPERHVARVAQELANLEKTASAPLLAQHEASKPLGRKTPSQAFAEGVALHT
jgi:hypothetical protein